MNTKQVFDMLRQEQKANGGSGSGGSGESGNFDSHDWEGAAEMDTKEAEVLARDVEQALRQGKITAQKMAGKGSANMPRELGELLDPQVNWRDLLREFATASCTAKEVSSWRRPNRRFIGMDIFLPTMIGETVREVVFLIDASGSTFVGKMLDVFLSEVKSVAETVRPEKVHLIYWDTKVTKHETYGLTDLDSIVTSTIPTGGGGTTPSCAEAYLEKEKIIPDCIINLTDGYVGTDWGNNWPAPILWVIAGNPGATATTGKSIHIND